MAEAVLQEEVELLLDEPRDSSPAERKWVTSAVSPAAPALRTSSGGRGTGFPLGLRLPLAPFFRGRNHGSEVRERSKDTSTPVANPLWLLYTCQLGSPPQPFPSPISCDN